MLVAHVEQEGVWLRRWRHAPARRRRWPTLASARGATFRYGARRARSWSRGGRACRRRAGRRRTHRRRRRRRQCRRRRARARPARRAASPRPCRPSPPNARSLSAVTWAMRAQTAGFPLLRHNVFFSRDYARRIRRASSARRAAGRADRLCLRAGSRRRRTRRSRRRRTPALPRQCARRRRHRSPSSPSEIDQCERADIRACWRDAGCTSSGAATRRW